MRNLFLLITILLLTGCMGTGIKQNSYDTQNKRAKKSFEELDRETGGQTATERELEKVEEDMSQKSSKNNETSPTKSVKEKKNPNTVEEKKLNDDSYPMKNGKPVWFSNPTYNGYLGAVGIARKSSAGGSISRQKRLAKTLAQAELSKTINVVIDSELELERTQISKDVHSYYKSKLKTLSVHQASEVINDAVVKDTWTDSNDDLYLWLVLEK